MEERRLSGVIIIGWFFLLQGLLFIINQAGMPMVKADSVMLALIFIISGYFVLRQEEMGRKLTIFLSLFNLFCIFKLEVGLDTLQPLALPVEYGIYNMLACNRLSKYIAIILYGSIIYFLTRAVVREKFNKKLYEGLQVLEDKNKELAAKLKDLGEEVSRLKGTIKDKNKLIEAYQYQDKLKPKFSIVPAEAPIVRDLTIEEKFEQKIEQKKRRLGEILLENNLITKEILDKALEHQKHYGGSITQYLLYYGYIDEEQLAKCLCAQFGVPYLPLKSYDISDDIIKLIPVDIAEKYWLIPIDKQEDTLMIVMIDPLDIDVIKQLESFTGLKIRPFVGIISEIVSALKVYYNVFVRDGESPMKIPPFFVDTKEYKGVERRQSIRYNSKVDVKFPQEDKYKKTQTINVNRSGFAFASDTAMPIGTMMTMEIDLPKEYSYLPISAVAQVVRCSPREDKSFEVAVKILKISKQEIDIIIDYAARNAG